MNDKKVTSPAVLKQSQRNSNVVITLSALSTGLLIMMLISLAAGRYPVSVSKIITLLWECVSGKGMVIDNTDRLVLFSVRLPRMLAAILVGAALSGSGACYQGIFRNPMVEPSLLGVTSGAAFGSALGILFSAGIATIQLVSFLFGLGAVAITSGLSAFVNKQSERTLSLILCGIITGTLFSAFLSLAKYVADPNSKLPAITYWLMGSLASINFNDIQTSVVSIITGIIPLMLLRWRINVLSFGDEEAMTLGVNTRFIRATAIASSTLMTAAAVSISGMIGWIGLVIPHLARMLVGPSFPVLFPASVLLGSFFLLFVDTIARIVFPVEIPLGILTAITGAPFFVILLARGKRGWI